MKPAETFIFFPRSDLMQSERNAWDGQAGLLLAGESADKTKEFVRTRDYAILQDDVARLTLLYTQALNEVAMHKAEVDKLREAGDKMADRLMYQGYPETVPAWRKARGQEFKLS